ncbi:MAG: chromate transporter [Candidatus Kapaibacterium sp.]|jgi:chromate transporter
MIYLDLFLAFFKVGSFSFGGAYSLIPLIEKEAVQNYGWLTPDEFLHVLGMVEVFPGAISVKFATYTGYKAGGILGAVVANLGNLMVPAIVIMVASYFYSYYSKNEAVMKAFKGIKFAVIGMVAAIMFQYATKMPLEWKTGLIMAIGAALIIFFKLHPAYIVGISAIVALIIL